MDVEGHVLHDLAHRPVAAERWSAPLCGRELAGELDECPLLGVEHGGPGSGRHQATPQ